MADEELGTEIKEVFELEAYRKVMGEHLEKAAGEGQESEVERMEAAKVLGMMTPEPRVIRQLGRLLGDPSPDVLNYALDSAARLKRKELIPLIVRQLGNPQTRQVAKDALAAYGGRILGRPGAESGRSQARTSPSAGRSPKSWPGWAPKERPTPLPPNL